MLQSNIIHDKYNLNYFIKYISIGLSKTLTNSEFHKNDLFNSIT